MRNETFRMAWLKSLKSLRSRNHRFVGLFVFKGLDAISLRRFLIPALPVRSVMPAKANIQPMDCRNLASRFPRQGDEPRYIRALAPDEWLSSFDHPHHS